jgi:hypothetical protein
MNDKNLTFRLAVATNTVDHLGTVTNNAVTAAMTEATYTGNWFEIADLYGFPFMGEDLFFFFAATGLTSTGATGTASLVWQLDVADTATVGSTTGTVVQSFTARAIVATFASSASIGFAIDSVTYQLPTTFKLTIPRNTHRYGRIKATTTLGTITGVAYGLIGVAPEMRSPTTSVVDIT